MKSPTLGLYAIAAALAYIGALWAQRRSTSNLDPLAVGSRRAQRSVDTNGPIGPASGTEHSGAESGGSPCRYR